MDSILGFSTDQATDDLVAAAVVAKAQAIGATRVVMATHGGMNTAPGHGLGPQLLPGETGHDAENRAAAMCAIAQAQGLEATGQATMGPEGASVEAVCATFHPSAVIVGTPRHRLIGDLWDTESVRAAKHHCDDVEALHE